MPVGENEKGPYGRGLVGGLRGCGGQSIRQAIAGQAPDRAAGDHAGPNTGMTSYEPGEGRTKRGGKNGIVTVYEV